MLPRLTCLFLALVVVAALWRGHACLACTLNKTVYDENSGLLHRCLNSSGTTEWQENVACWILPPGTIGGEVVELEPGQSYRQSDGGRIIAECRSRYGTVALVYHVCFSNIAGPWKWPGEVWTGSDGLQYTCTNASLASSSAHYKQGSRVILFACNSTLSGRLVAPGESELHLLEAGIVRKCVFSGTDTRDIQYWMKPVGCWLQYNNSQIVQLAFGAEYSVSEYNGQKRVQTVLATCKQRSSNAQALVYSLCRENTTSGETLRQPKSVWTGTGGVQLECLPANPSELVSARIIPRACYENSSTSSFAPGADLRRSDGSIGRCVFSGYKSAYGWFDAVGCWPRDPVWSRVTSLSPSLQVGEEFCPDGKGCLARCEKRRYREEASLVAKVCFANVGEGVVFRMPNENWTDSSGVSRTCVPMADQASNFGVGAETILRGCAIDKLGKKAAQPGELTYADDSIVYECAFNSYLRRYSFNRVAGCWMHDQTGRRVVIAGGESRKLPSGQKLATCRRVSSNRFVFTAEVCFRSSDASHLKWDNSSIALPGDTVSNGTVRLQCNPAATHSWDGAHARWIVYGCQSVTDGLVVPGTARNFKDGTVKECAHNQRSGSSAAYSWDKTVACWFRDHLGQTIVISQFNAVYNHSAVGNKPTARCQQLSRYSVPKLQLFVCFSSINSRFYAEGDTWRDSATGLAKQCVGASTYPGEGVVEIDAGCWLQAPKSNGNSQLTPTQRQLFSSSGSVAYGSEHRILRCDFNERARKYEWLTSVACWHSANRTRAILLMGQEHWSGGLLIFRCLNHTRKGAVLVQYACEQNGSWHGAFSKWNDTNYRYKCEPALGDRSAKVDKTHCMTADGTAIEQSQTKGGVQYVCMRICGMLVSMRDPTPLQYKALYSLMSNCHATNINIINNIG